MRKFAFIQMHSLRWVLFHMSVQHNLNYSLELLLICSLVRNIITNMVSVKELENEIKDLKTVLAEKESLLKVLKATEQIKQTRKDRLTNTEISRYSRQIILSEIGVKGQLALKNAAILIVGTGGLGNNLKKCNSLKPE